MSSIDEKALREKLTAKSYIPVYHDLNGKMIELSPVINLDTALNIIESAKSSEGDDGLIMLISNCIAECADPYEITSIADTAEEILEKLRPYLRTPAQVSGEERFKVWDDRQCAWWRPDAKGYTNKSDEAGLFEARDIAQRNAKLSCRRLSIYPALTGKEA